MKRKPTHWEDGDEFGSDILGVGSYHFIHGGSGKAKTKQIGFVRQDDRNNQKRKPNRPKVAGRIAGKKRDVR